MIKLWHKLKLVEFDYVPKIFKKLNKKESKKLKVLFINFTTLEKKWNNYINNFRSKVFQK